MAMKHHHDGAFRVYASGRTEVGENLKVDGNIQAGGNVCAKKFLVRVTPDCVPDYVFTSEYKLLPLCEVQTFVQENRHLPGVLSAQHMAESGSVDLSMLGLKNLEKIEENMLYILQLNDRLDKLEAENLELRQMLVQLLSR
jgi:hypothetical protein